MNLVWFLLGAGTLLVVVRRPFARNIVESQRACFDRALDVDEVAAGLALMGAVLIGAGVLNFFIWLHD